MISQLLCVKKYKKQGWIAPALLKTLSFIGKTRCPEKHGYVYNGYLEQSSFTVLRTSSFTFVFLGCERTLSIHSAIFIASVSFMPREVIVGVPIRIPLGSFAPLSS